MGNPTPYHSAIDAPIEIRAKQHGVPEIASWVYPDEVDSTRARMTEQGYTVTSLTNHRSED
jgi:hypothetical protein